MKSDLCPLGRDVLCAFFCPNNRSVFEINENKDLECSKMAKRAFVFVLLVRVRIFSLVLLFS